MSCKTLPKTDEGFDNDRVNGQYGQVEGRAKILSCQKPPHKKYGPSMGNAKLWNSAGVSPISCH